LRKNLGFSIRRFFKECNNEEDSEEGKCEKQSKYRKYSLYQHLENESNEALFFPDNLGDSPAKQDYSDNPNEDEHHIRIFADTHSIAMITSRLMKSDQSRCRGVAFITRSFQQVRGRLFQAVFRKPRGERR